MWMEGSEWLDSLIPVSPYWFVRTLAGLSMDVGMSLLVVNLMLTALTRPTEEVREAPRAIPGAAAAGGAAR
jgi:cytochrome c oxidase cbb3-type subunit 1